MLFRSQSDMINVVVYKVDVLNSDIIYLPKKFMFELSRFPVRNENWILNLEENSIDKIASSIPTRDSADINASPIYDPGQLDDTYSFLSFGEKKDLLRNHALSFLYEVYVKLLTGISVADHQFDVVKNHRLVDDEFIKSLIDACIDAIRNKPKYDISQSRNMMFSTMIDRSIVDRKSTRLNSSHVSESRMPSSA